MRLSCLVALLALSCACAAAPRAAPAPRARITLTYLGVAGWQLSDGKTTVLVDPYFSRPDLSDGRKVAPDEDQLAARFNSRADVILVSHSHLDHVLDVPSLAKLTGAQIIGSESSANYARAAGVPGDKIITVKGGEDYDFGAFSVRALPSLHSALGRKHNFGASKTIPAGVALPMTFDDFHEGGTFAYLVRLAGHEVLFLSTANFIERELAGLRPDVAVVATGLRGEIFDYTCRLAGLLGRPKLFLANHFDAWKKPLGKTLELTEEDKSDLSQFAAEARSCSPETRVVVPEHLQPIGID